MSGHDRNPDASTRCARRELLAADRQQVALVAGQRLAVDQVVAGLDGRGVVGDLLALGVVHRHGQPDPGLVDDLDQGRGRRAGLERDRLLLLLGQRLLDVSEQLELVPAGERLLLELLLERLELAVDRRLVTGPGRELEEVAVGDDVGAGGAGRDLGGERDRERGDQQATAGGWGHSVSASSSCGVTQIRAALPSSSFRLITVLEPPGVSSESISGAARCAAGRTSIAWALDAPTSELP